MGKLFVLYLGYSLNKPLLSLNCYSKLSNIKCQIFISNFLLINVVMVFKQTRLNSKL